MDRRAAGNALARQPHHFLRSIHGEYIVAALGKRQGVPTYATTCVQDASTGPDMREEAPVDRLHVDVSGLCSEISSMPVVVAYGVSHRVSHRRQPRLEPTDG